MQRRQVSAGRPGAVSVLPAGVERDRHHGRAGGGHGPDRHLPLTGASSPLQSGGLPCRAGAVLGPRARPAFLSSVMLFLLKRTWPGALAGLAVLAGLGFLLRR